MNPIFRKLKKNSKALSPVVASIILIAVTVAVSVVVAAWMGGMTIGLMGSAEQAAITNVQFTDGGTGVDSIAVTIQNTGDASVTIGSVFVDNAPIDPDSVTGEGVAIPKSTTGTVTISLPTGTLVSGTQYTVKLVTQEGNSLVYSATFS